jgi:hypothetical protein
VVGDADCAQRVLAYRFRFSEVNDEVDYVHSAKHEAKENTTFRFRERNRVRMEILAYFLTFPGQLAFDSRHKTPCEAQSMERCLACEGGSVGTVELDGLSDGNERMALMRRMRLI